MDFKAPFQWAPAYIQWKDTKLNCMVAGHECRSCDKRLPASHPWIYESYSALGWKYEKAVIAFCSLACYKLPDIGRCHANGCEETDVFNVYCKKHTWLEKEGSEAYSLSDVILLPF
jgi:hypothetical protein